jgi:hypothetical protein
MQKSSIIKVLIILFGHLWEVELTYRYIFAFKFTLFPLFAAGVVDTGGAPLLANISANFRKKSKRSLWDTLGLGEN